MISATVFAAASPTYSVGAHRVVFNWTSPRLSSPGLANGLVSRNSLSSIVLWLLERISYSRLPLFVISESCLTRSWVWRNTSTKWRWRVFTSCAGCVRFDASLDRTSPHNWFIHSYCRVLITEIRVSQDFRSQLSPRYRESKMLLLASSWTLDRVTTLLPHWNNFTGFRFTAVFSSSFAAWCTPFMCNKALSTSPTWSKDLPPTSVDQDCAPETALNTAYQDVAVPSACVRSPTPVRSLGTHFRLRSVTLLIGNSFGNL